ncbi:7052_t:CDS:2 [Funneliformis geosporum]|uniref:7127_t:CDS:1 n=1 Tax=Funneliformis geosporum TaxID=1117311 RepID=A0A9W4WZR7_9GLOM|nr:7052_t:CDS:2 [Funneliformis geosporum]CAI2184576.1 7127_t:CDS:2 [Funneliformis geosporum]
MGSFLAKERMNKNNKPPPSTTDANKEQFRYIEGRRFNNVQSSKYVLPNDDEECDRLHMQHFLMRYAWQGNFASPVEHILNGDDSKVLDVGCGAGSWSFEIATTYPKAKITGVDISPVQPSIIKPKNVTFIQADILEGLSFADETFDFVFQRFLTGSIPKDKWLSVIKELTRMLKPGGYLELVEFNVLSERLGPTSLKIANALYDLCEQRNLETKMVPKLKSYVEKEGKFEDIKEEIKLIYGGKAEGKLGIAYNDDMMGLYENTRVLMVPFMQISNQEYDQMLKIIKEEWLELNSYTRFIRVYARKI